MNETGTKSERDGAPDPESAWAAVASRDPRFDGRFVFAVASTGIYCRPSCPSRRPRRDRVAFFPDPAAAERAGYRACRRCRPDGTRPAGAAGEVERARAFLDAHLDETVTLERLGREVGVSPWHLQRTFKRSTGVTPKAYVQARRAERLKARLQRGDTVIDATFEAGYGAASRLYEQSDARLGMTPAAYRRGGAGMRLRYEIVPSPLGRLLVAATERGVSAVTLGDDDDELVQALRREYPRAAIEPASGELAAWIEPLVASLAGAGDPTGLPLDLQGTAFQWRVWQALRRIPRGATRTYGEVAADIGAPAAARAVARACAGNRVALTIPCHRVVRGDGEAGGYRWGEERKRRLLEGERGE